MGHEYVGHVGGRQVVCLEDCDWEGNVCWRLHPATPLHACPACTEDPRDDSGHLVVSSTASPSTYALECWVCGHRLTLLSFGEVVLCASCVAETPAIYGTEPSEDADPACEACRDRPRPPTRRRDGDGAGVA